MKRKITLGLIVAMAAVMFTSCLWIPYSGSSTNNEPFETTIANVSYSYAAKDSLFGTERFDQITITVSGNTNCFTPEHMFIKVTDPNGVTSNAYIAEYIPTKLPASTFYCNLTNVNGSSLRKDFITNGSTITVGVAVVGGQCPNYSSWHQHTLTGTASCTVSK